jgi:TonB family protein
VAFLASTLAGCGTTPSADERSDASAQAKLLASTLDEIRAKVRRLIVEPPGVSPSALVEFDVVLTSSGHVLSVMLRRSSGNSLYDEAAMRAIRRAEPLPIPPEPRLFAQFRELRLQFRPQDGQPAVQPPSQTAPMRSEDPSDPARSAEIARLRALLAGNLDAYRERPWRSFIGSRPAEYRFASYAKEWQAKIEATGSLSCSDEARREKLRGSLVLSVSIRRDGSVDSIEVNRSSGFKVLDQAAICMVERAAPFSPLPPDIAKDTDLLVIIRTWSIGPDDRLLKQ